MAFIPVPGGRSLRLVKNRGRSFVKGVNQNSPLFFTEQSTLLTKLSLREGKLKRGSGELEFESGGEVAPNFDSRFGG